MDLKEAEKLVWDKILQEEKDNFIPEFQKQVLEILKLIMELD